MAATDVLLVEGPDDVYFFAHLLEHHGIVLSERHRDEPGKVKIVDGGGYENLRSSIPVRLKGSDLRRLGIVVDADTDFAARWQSLRDVLSAVGYTSVPTAPLLDGTVIISPDRPVVGVWLMPDNVRPGMLEDFARLLVPAGDPLLQRVDPCLQAIPASERRWSAIHHAKAEIHTWLAWQDEPGRPIGQAIAKKYLDADAPPARQIIDWVRRLFA
jgi:hypothetical protein